MSGTPTGLVDVSCMIPAAVSFSLCMQHPGLLFVTIVILHVVAIAANVMQAAICLRKQGGLFGRQAEVEVRKQLAEARARGEGLQEEAAQLVTRLQAAVEDGDAAKSKLVGERDNSATLERARSSAVQVLTLL